MDVATDPPPTPRRNFFRWITYALGGVASAAVALPFVGYIFGERKRPDDWVERALELCREREHTLLVLHDVPSGAMRHLERFLDSGLEFTQAFPPACVPLRRGEGSLVEYVDPLEDADGVA